MATRSDTFRVVFEVQNDGTIKAAFADVGKEAQNAGEAVDKAGDRWEALGNRIGNSLKVAGGLAAAGLAVVIRNTIQAEQELAQLDAILRSTGNAAGFSRDQLVSMANQLSQSSIFSGGEIIEAQTRLLSYSGIIGENIPRAMQAVIDQSTRLGISVSQSAEIIGRALESPSKAAAALAQQGFGAAFTEEVRETIKALEEQGRAADAQRMILEILEESYGGAAQAARDTFGGALVALKNTLMDVATGGDGSLDSTTQAINDLIDTLNDPAVRQGFADIVDGILSVMGQAAAAIPLLVQFNAELSKAYGIGTQQGQTRAGNIGDFIAGNRDFWGDLLSGRGFNAGANARIRAGFAGGPIANFSNVSTADPRNALADFSNVSTADPRDARRVTGGGGGKDRAAKLSDEERALRQLQERYGRYLQQLQQENELHGDNSQLARVNYEIKRDGLDKVNPALAELLRQEAAHADLLGEIEEHERIAAEAREEHEEAIRRQQEAYDELIGSLRTELEIMGMSRVEANALLAIRRLGISETSKEADEIRGLYQAIEDNERVIAAMDAVRQAGSDLFVDVLSGGNPFDAAEQALDRLNQRILQMIADNLMEQLFGDFGSTGQGSSGGGWLSALFGSGGGGGDTAFGTGSFSSGGGGGFWSNLFGSIFGGGKAYGGETRPNMLHEITELGAPEVFRTRNGRQYLLTGSEAGSVEPLAPGIGAGDVFNITVPADGIMDYRSRRQYADDFRKEIALSGRNR